MCFLDFGEKKWFKSNLPTFQQLFSLTLVVTTILNYPATDFNLATEFPR